MISIAGKGGEGTRQQEKPPRTFIDKAVAAARIFAAASVSACGEDFEPDISGAVPRQDGLTRGYFGHVHLVGSLVPRALVVVHRHRPARCDGEYVLSRAGLVAAHVDATNVRHWAIVLCVLGPAASAPLGARDTDVGKMIWSAVGQPESESIQSWRARSHGILYSEPWRPLLVTAQ